MNKTIQHCLINDIPTPYPQTLTTLFNEECNEQRTMTFTVNPKNEQGVVQHISKHYKKEVIEKIVLKDVVNTKLKTLDNDVVECAREVYWLVFLRSGYVVSFIEYPWSFTKIPEGYYCRPTNDFHAFSRNRWHRSNSNKVAEKYKQWMGDIVQS